MVNLEWNRLKGLENDSLRIEDIGGGVLHREFDSNGIGEEYLNARYKFLQDLNNDYDPSDFSVFHLNCQGISISFQYLEEVLQTQGLQVLALTETWLKSHTSSLLDVPNYQLVLKNRELHQHGGLAAYIKSDFNVLPMPSLTKHKEMVFESMVVKVSKQNFKCVLAIIYRPPSSSLVEFLSLLEEQLDLLSGTRQPCFVCGDFNIDLKSLHSSQRVKEFLDMMLSYGLKPTINICTRITENSASILDNIFVNTEYKSPAVVVNSVSDHFGVMITVPQVLQLNKGHRCNVIRPIIDSEVVARFKLEVDKTEFNFLKEEYDINRKFEKWYETLTGLLQKYVKPKRVYRYESAKKPWITKSLLLSMRRRNHLYKELIQNKGTTTRDDYKAYNNMLNCLLRKAKTDYFAFKFKEAEGNPGKTWKLIKSVTNPSRSPSELPDSVSCNSVCEHFSNVGLNVGSSIPVLAEDGDFTQFLPDKSEVSAYLKPVKLSELCEVVKNMKNSAAGSDLMTVKAFRVIYPIVSSQLVMLINECFKSGIFPDCLKIAKVKPLFKGGDSGNLDNYRPISLLPVISRIIERLINVRMVNFLESRSFFRSSQFGFRKGMSTEQAVIFLTTFVNDHLDRGLKVASVFLDIMKAFDCVDYEILVKKLDNCGIRGKFLELVRSFLSERMQIVQIESETSSPQRVKAGVPQGSVLGPLLFLIYINDIYRCIEDINISDKGDRGNRIIIPSFADDTHFTVAARTERELLLVLKKGMEQIEKWMRVNKLKLNHKKSQFVIYGRSVNYYPWIEKLELDGNAIERVRAVKFLGVIVDECLSFKDHINQIAARVARNLGIIRKLKRTFPRPVLRMLYFSLIHPYLIYCILAWSSTFVGHLSQIRVLQNKAVRVLTGDDKRSSVRARYAELHIVPLFGLIKFYNALFMFKHQNKMLPICFQDFFLPVSSFHSYSLRLSNEFRLPKPVTTRSMFCIRHVSPRAWNSLPEGIKKVTDVSEFRSLLKEHCYRVYGSE